MKIDSFTDIEAWKQARLFVADIYNIFSQGNSQKDFGFRDQIQRASVSIMSNIAEGGEQRAESRERRAER